MTRFEACLSFVLDREGRTDKEPKNDPNTNWGITQPVYDEYRRAKSLAEQNVDLAKSDELVAVYYEKFWQGARCDVLPQPLDLLHFDSAVNCGTGTANRMLQSSLGLVLLDGVIGKKTLEAIRLTNTTKTFGNYVRLRIARYIAIAANPEKAGFLRGWLHRVGIVLQQA